jgi:uncharacterized protein (DUF1786 family)
MKATIVTDEIATVDAVADRGRLLLDPEALPDAFGWEWKPEGLCRDNVCVPVRDRAAVMVGGRLDVAAVAAALGRAAVVDADAGLAAIALPKESRHAALVEHHAPAFTLRDLEGVEHDLGEWAGTKKLLVAFASW